MTSWQPRHVIQQMKAIEETNTIAVKLGQNKVIWPAYGH